MKRNAIVVKYGGSSLRTAGDFGRARDYLLQLKGRGYRPIAVVSAPKGVSDMLIDAWGNGTDPYDKLEADGRYRAHMSGELRRELSRMRELLMHGRDPDRHDEFLSLGENHSGIMLSGLLREAGTDSVYYDGFEAGVKVGPASVDVKESVSGISKVISGLSRGSIPVIGGYVGASTEGGYMLMGRNSTDITKALAAAAAGAVRCENIKDNPVRRMQPQIEINGKGVIEIKTDPVRKLSYGEAINMGWRQSEVVHPAAVKIARDYSVPIVVRELGGEGTTISTSSGTTAERPVAALSVRACNVMGIVDPGMDMATGYIAMVSSAFESQGISIIDMSAPPNTLCITFPTKHNKTRVDVAGLEAAMRETMEAREISPDYMRIEERIAISMVGDSMNRAGVLRRVTKPFEDAEVSIRMASLSDELEAPPSIDFYIDAERDPAERALRAFCDEFDFLRTAEQ